MRYSVSLRAEGDRVIELAEVVEFADAVAIHSGIASGVNTMSYGAQLVVEAADSDSAVKSAVELFNNSVHRASMPVWPITEVEVLAEDEDYEEYPGESE